MTATFALPIALWAASTTTLDSTVSAHPAANVPLSTAEMIILANLAAQPFRLLAPIMMAATATNQAHAPLHTALVMSAHPVALLLPLMVYTRMDVSAQQMTSACLSIVQTTPASHPALTSNQGHTLMVASALQAVNVSLLIAFPTLVSPLVIPPKSSEHIQEDVSAQVTMSALQATVPTISAPLLVVSSREMDPMMMGATVTIPTPTAILIIASPTPADPHATPLTVKASTPTAASAPATLSASPTDAS